MSAHYCNACKLGLGFEGGLSGVHECKSYDKPVPGYPSYPREHMKVSELQLGDRVALTDDILMADFMTAEVTKITKDEVWMVRPYVHTGDVESTAGLSWYLGAEVCKYPRDSSRKLYVYSRKVTV